MVNKYSMEPKAMKFIPSVNELLNLAEIFEHPGNLLPSFKTQIIREVIQDFKTNIDYPTPKSKKDASTIIVPRIIKVLDELEAEFPRRVINGTGIHIHTNLGRAPLGSQILKSLPAALSGYTNLEFDTKTSKRGSRDQNIGHKMALLTGAESALAVNNAASALFLILNTLSRDKPVLVSRGELVEIGGSFRIPDIIEASGCVLKEIGTTNKTHLSDYKNNITPETKVLLKVHQSNFTQSGFVNSVDSSELIKLAKQTKKILVEDNGSGLLKPSLLNNETDRQQTPNTFKETDVITSLKQGTDIVCFSGDKLMGGIQAGLIVGKKRFIQKMRKNPLYRILRLDKVRMHMLDSCLRQYLTGKEREIPLWSFFQTSVAHLQKRTGKITQKHPKSSLLEVKEVPLKKKLGGGSDPEKTYESWGLAIKHPSISSTQLRDLLANRTIPIVGYLKKDKLILDISGFQKNDLLELQQALNEVR